MAVEEEDDGGGIPEWVVTFGDMMSLLLTFFIMLVSLSEVKKEETYQALAESMRRRFGSEASILSSMPGKSVPRNSNLAQMATMGRAQRLDIMRGGDKTRAPVGDNPQVRVIREGKRTAVGTVISFGEGKAELDELAQQILLQQVSEFKGKSQKIEIRGHTSQRPVGKDSLFRDNLELAYQRCRQTMEFLVGMGIESKRIRLSVAGPNEPRYIGTAPIQLKQNPRVEVFLLDEVVDDLIGTSDKRQQRFNSPLSSEDDL